MFRLIGHARYGLPALVILILSALTSGGTIASVQHQVLRVNDREYFETHGLNVVGLTRRGFSEDAINVLKKAYRIFYRQNLSVDEAVVRIRAEVPATPEVETFLAFVLTSERGLTR